MKKLFLTLPLAALLSACPAPVSETQGTQPIAPAWQGLEDTTQWNISIHNSDEDYFRNIAVDGDGNVYLAGMSKGLISSPYPTALQWWIRKFNKNGQEIKAGWDKRFERGADSISVEGLCVKANGEVAALACYEHAQQEYYILKIFGKDGFEISTVELPFPFNRVNGMAIDTAGNMYVAAHSNSVGSPNYLVKLDAAGAIQLQVKIVIKGITATLPNFEATCVAFDNNQDVLIGGYGTNLVTSNSARDSWFQRYSPAGDLLSETVFSAQAASFGSSSIVYTNDVINAITAAPDGTVYTAGHGYAICLAEKSTGPGSAMAYACNNDVGWINGFSPTEKIVFEAKIWSGDTNDCVMDSIALDKNGKITVSGFDKASHGSGDISWVIKKFDTNALEIWSNITTVNKYSSWPADDHIVVGPDNSLFAACTGVDVYSGNSTLDWWIRRFY